MMINAQSIVLVVLVAGALALAFMVLGLRAFVRMLVPAGSLAVLVFLVTTLMADEKNTALVQAGWLTVTAGDLRLGLYAALLLLGTLVLFSSMPRLVRPDAVGDLLGRRFAYVGLTLTLMLRAVATIGRQAQTLREVERAFASGGVLLGHAFREGVGGWLAVRTAGLAEFSGRLLARSLASSETQARSMRARGWGAVARPTVLGRAGGAQSRVPVVLVAVVAAGAVLCAAVRGFSLAPLPAQAWQGLAILLSAVLAALPLSWAAWHLVRWVA